MNAEVPWGLLRLDAQAHLGRKVLQVTYCNLHNNCQPLQTAVTAPHFKKEKRSARGKGKETLKKRDCWMACRPNRKLRTVTGSLQRLTIVMQVTVHISVSSSHSSHMQMLLVSAWARSGSTGNFMQAILWERIGS